MFGNISFNRYPKCLSLRMLTEHFVLTRLEGKFMRKGSKKLIMWIYQKILKIRSSVSSSVILMLEMNLIR